MDLKRFCFICFSLVLSFALPGNVWAGQVVTDDIRAWAHQTVKAEKSIEAVTSANTLAVLYFQNKTGRQELDPLQKGLSLMLITDLSIVKNLQVVERAKLQALVEELGLGVSGLVEPSAAPRVGKLLGARRVLGGDFARAEQERLRVQSRLLDAVSTSLIGQSVSEGLLDELFRIEKDLLFDIVKLLKIEVPPELEQKLKKACSTKKDALFALFNGIDASDQKDYENAAEWYRKALNLDPEICVAGEALNELQTLGLISVRKRTGDLLNSLRSNTSLTNQLTPKEEFRQTRFPNQVPSNANIDVIFPAAPSPQGGGGGSGGNVPPN